MLHIEISVAQRVFDRFSVNFLVTPRHYLLHIEVLCYTEEFLEEIFCYTDEFSELQKTFFLEISRKCQMHFTKRKENYS